MNLLHQLLCDLGVGEENNFSVILGYGVYFQGVKKVLSCQEGEFCLLIGKNTVKISGENLRIEKFFQSDLLIAGTVSGVQIEK